MNFSKKLISFFVKLKWLKVKFKNEKYQEFF